MSHDPLDDGHATPTFDEQADDDFLIREGLDLLAAYRAIKSDVVRQSILAMIAAVVQAEDDARTEAS